MIIFLPRAQKLSILPTSLDVFDLWQHFVHILYLPTVFQNILSFVLNIFYLNLEAVESNTASDWLNHKV